MSWEDAARYLNALTRAENRTRAANDLPALSECFVKATWAWDEGCTGYRLLTARWGRGRRTRGA
ncbi:MAG: hypothetical protein H6721_00045 [Sandaracinus sp.]|nr:hypothetical protein [Sandaracinus sp.]